MGLFGLEWEDVVGEGSILDRATDIASVIVPGAGNIVNMAQEGAEFLVDDDDDAPAPGQQTGPGIPDFGPGPTGTIPGSIPDFGQMLGFGGGGGGGGQTTIPAPVGGGGLPATYDPGAGPLALDGGGVVATLAPFVIQALQTLVGAVRTPGGGGVLQAIARVFGFSLVRYPWASIASAAIEWDDLPVWTHRPIRQFRAGMTYPVRCDEHQEVLFWCLVLATSPYPLPMLMEGGQIMYVRVDGRPMTGRITRG